MIPKIIVGLISLILVSLSFNPLWLGSFFLFVRPLIQPFAHAGHKLIPGVPLTGSVAMIFIVLSTVPCLYRKGYRIFLPTIIPLYLLLFFSILSFFNTIDYMVSISHVLKLGSGITMYFLLYNAVNTHDDARKVLYAAVLSAVVIMAFGYYQVLAIGYGKVLFGSSRIDGFLDGANVYGVFLSVTFCCALILLLQSTSRSHRFFVLCIMASMIVSMILSRNRGQWIALVTGLIIAYFGYMDKIKVRKFLIPGILIMIVFSGIIVQRFEGLHEQTHWGGTKNTLDSRIYHWKNALNLVPEHPLIGHGIGTATKLAGIHYGNPVPPHNDYIRLLLETGVTGLLLYLWFLLSVLINNIRMIFDKKNWFINYPMLALTVYWIIHSYVQNMIYNVSLFSLFMALLAVSKKWNLCKTDDRQ